MQRDLMDYLFIIFMACACLTFLTLAAFMIWIMFNAEAIS